MSRVPGRSSPAIVCRDVDYRSIVYRCLKPCQTAEVRLFASACNAHPRTGHAQMARCIAPMTTKSRAAPFRIGVTHGGRKGLILLDQMRAMDKVRLAKKLGVVSAKTLT